MLAEDRNPIESLDPLSADFSEKNLGKGVDIPF
jgi:hypothetical protein